MHAQLELIQPVLDLDVERQLRHRMAMAGPSDMTRGIFFNGALDVARALGGSEAADRCQYVLGEKHFIDFFNYPVVDLLRMSLEMIRVVGAHTGGCAGVLRRLGMQNARDFLSSASGRTMLLLAGNNPRRLLNQLPTSYHTAVTFGERRVLWSSQDRQGLFVVKQDFMPPAYTKGLLQGMLEAVGARGVHVSGWPTGMLDSEYAVTWER
jgi:uncharacterized protein (TIGR02265 family)